MRLLNRLIERLRSPGGRPPAEAGSIAAEEMERLFWEIWSGLPTEDQEELIRLAESLVGERERRAARDAAVWSVWQGLSEEGRSIVLGKMVALLPEQELPGDGEMYDFWGAWQELSGEGRKKILKMAGELVEMQERICRGEHGGGG